MMNNWKELSLMNLSKSITSGLTPLRSKVEFWENGNIKWLKTDQLGNKYIYDTNEYISTIALNTTKIKINKINTISIAMYGEGKTRGSISILKDNMATNQACCNVYLDKDTADVEYVYYYLKTQYNNLRNLSSGVRKNLNSNDIKNFKINIPKSIATQKAIAKVLSDLDAKIEVNNKINKELEAMAKTLYDYWFVQFDFPNDEGKPYKSSGGKMVYNEDLKCEIPEGWECKRLEEIEPNIITGKTPSTKINEYFDGDIPFITINDIRNNLYIQNTERTLSNDGAETQKNKYLYPDDVCVSCIGTVGVIGFVSKLSQSNQQINTISKPERKNKYFLYESLQNYFKFNDNAKQGAVLVNMNKEEFSSIPILNPLEDLKLKYADRVDFVFKKIKSNIQENQQLIELRDWLLPMLMNGQVSVK